MQWLVTQLFNLLLEMYKLLPNLGVVIIVFTILVRGVILLLTWKSLKSAHERQGKMMAMNEEMEELKKKYGENKEVLAAKQMELMKKYNINPLAGLLPQILQLFVLILFYQAIFKFVNIGIVDGVVINTNFGMWNLIEKDPLFILPVVAGVTQFLLSLMISKGAQVRDMVSNKKNAPVVVKEANKQEENTANMAASMQKQMMVMMPVMTVMIGLGLPAGVVLYWIVGTVFSIFQQAAISGWGGLAWKKNN